MIVLFSVLGTALGGAVGALSRWKLDLAVKTRWMGKRALAGKPSALTSASWSSIRLVVSCLAF